MFTNIINIEDIKYIFHIIRIVHLDVRGDLLIECSSHLCPGSYGHCGSCEEVQIRKSLCEPILL